MHASFYIAAVILSLPSLVVGVSCTPTLLTQFSPSVRIENLTIFPNSTVVVCNAFTGQLFGIDPLKGASVAAPYLINTLEPRPLAIFGLASAFPYTIAAAASNFSWNPPSVFPGSNAVHYVTLTDAGPETKVFPIPSAAWLNGLTSVPGAPHYLLVADCLAGSLLRLDTRTGSFETVSSDPLFAPVNGSYSELALYGRLAITSEGLAVGTSAEVKAHAPNGSTFDDFALRSDGVGFLATGLGSLNGIEKVTRTGDA